MNKLKKMLVTGVLFMGIAISFSTNTVFAASNWGEHWGATLNKCCVWGGEDHSKNMMYRGDNITPRMSLQRIVNGPSYYVRGAAVNSNHKVRTDKILLKQNGGRKELTGSIMQDGHKYFVAVRNDKFENEYRWAYGRFQW